MIGHKIGPFCTMSLSPVLILINLRLNSNPQPFESRKSSSIFPSISNKFALNVSWSFLRSTVDIVTVLPSCNLYVNPIFSRNFVKRIIVSSHFVVTKNLVILRTSLWNGFDAPLPWVAFNCVQSNKSSIIVGCEKQ